MKIASYKDLIVWPKAMHLTELIYEITKDFPKNEIYGITSQMRRSAISIPSNIAEGRRRSSKKDYAQFLKIAFGSCTELETQIEICKRIKLGKVSEIRGIESLINEIIKMLSKMIYNLSNS